MEAYSSSSTPARLQQNSQEAQSSLYSSIHSVRKSPAKPWNRKPIAPMPPTRPRVYKVDPVNFRDLVQRLTGAGAPECSSQSSFQRLKSVAPPPLNVATARSFFGEDIAAGAGTAPLLQPLPSPAETPFSALYKDLMYDISDAKSQKTSDCAMASNSALGLSLSPSSHNWCAYPLLSPGSLSSLEQSAVL